MPYCPKCKKEYGESTEACSDCGTKLILSLSDEFEETDDKEAFLINASDEMQANILISKLSAFGIPVMKKYAEVGLPSIMGNSHLGIDLYVPSRLFENAKDIIKEESLSDDEVAFDNMLNDYGFEDIDNMDFDENEQETTINKQPDMTSNTLVDTPRAEIKEDRNYKPEKVSKNNNIPAKLFALIMLIIIGISLIHSAFQIIGRILGLL